MLEYNLILETLQTLPHPYIVDGEKLYQPDLFNMLKLDEYLSYPSKKTKFIHIAGTNGKGSCSHFIAAVLMNMGYKVGMYNSPHFNDFRERIKINGKIISQKAVCCFFEKIWDYINCTPKTLSFNPNWQKPTYSEVFVSMAFDYFEKEKVDFAIVEVGIGGRLDPTNIIPSPLLTIISSIGLEHTELLGETIEYITYEKSGIIKYNAPVIVGNVPNNAKKVIIDISNQRGAKCYLSEEYYTKQQLSKNKIFHNEEYDLAGDYQKINLKTVLCALDIFEKEYRSIFPSNIPYKDVEFALKNTAKLTDFRGRWETLYELPRIICDISCNAFGLEVNIDQLKKMLQTGHYERLIFILAFVSDEYLKIASKLPKDAIYIFTQSENTIDAKTISDRTNVNGFISKSIKEAFEVYWSISRNSDLVYVGGTIYIMGELFHLF